jgi:ubiquinone/menaquinone biosynthesis C-methylase UbiE
MPEPPEPSWSEIAVWYDQLLEQGSGPHDMATASLLRLAPDVTGASVLDIACGQGLATRALAAAGAKSVIGVDSSVTMIELAKARTQLDAAIVYRVDDAQALASCSDSEFDGVACQLGLMDIPDLDATLASVRRVLRPGGWFVFIIGHPCFLAPDAATLTDDGGRTGRFIPDYLHERFWRSLNPSGVRRVGNYHRTLSTYLNALGCAGFTVEECQEPPAEPLLARQQPVYLDVPIFLAVRARASADDKGSPFVLGRSRAGPLAPLSARSPGTRSLG